MRHWLLVGLLIVSLDVAGDCRRNTQALDDMAKAELVLAGPGARLITLVVRVADDFRARAAGFQHICPETIEETAIYFAFDRPRRPSFHMKNVKAPLDIAFIDRDGVIVDIQRMEPYVLGAKHHETYSPPREVAATLEARAGFFAGQRVTAGDWRVESLHQ